MNEEIKRMKAYLGDAEAFVDTVYHFAMKQGSIADELRSNMNAAGNAINEGYGLLNKLMVSEEEQNERSN